MGVSAKTSITGSMWCRCACRRFPNGVTIFRLLVMHFMKRLSVASGLAMREIGDDAMAVLQAHNWPGNVRQLRNIVERLLILATDDAAQVISADLLPPDLGASAPWGNAGKGDLVISMPLREAREIFERDYLSGADQSLRRQYLAHGGLYRHGTLRVASQVEIARSRPDRPRSGLQRLMRWPARSSARPHRLCERPLSRRMPQAGVHIEDRGLQFGDAIYEVVGVVDGMLRDEEDHLDRLERSLREIRVAMPMSRAALKFIFREIARRNRLRNGLIYLQVTRGAFRRDHPIPNETIKPTLILTAREMDRAAIDLRKEKGIKVVTRPDERWGRCDIKTTQLLANLMAKTEARKAGAYEAWLVDRDGFVTEGSSTNAWIVTAQGEIITRNLSHAILPGVTRRVILEAAAAAQMKVIERPFTPEEAKQAKEAFLSAATGAGVPIIAIDGTKVGDGKPGPVTRRVQEIYEDWVRSHTENAKNRA